MTTTLQQELLEGAVRVLKQTEIGRKVMSGSSTEIAGPLSGATTGELTDRMLVPMIRAELEAMGETAARIDRTLQTLDARLSEQ